MAPLHDGTTTWWHHHMIAPQTTFPGYEQVFSPLTPQKVITRLRVLCNLAVKMVHWFCQKENHRASYPWAYVCFKHLMAACGAPSLSITWKHTMQLRQVSFLVRIKHYFSKPQFIVVINKGELLAGHFTKSWVMWCCMWCSEFRYQMAHMVLLLQAPNNAALLHVMLLLQAPQEMHLS